jgi:hypothetical protein
MTEQLTRLICEDETVCRSLPCEIDTAARLRLADCLLQLDE